MVWGAALAESPKPIDAVSAIELLNEFLARDPVAVKSLFRYRARCNAELAAHPCIHAGHGPSAEDVFGDAALAAGEYSLGLLGFLNGLFGVDERGFGFITAAYADDGSVVAFLRTP